MTVVEPAPPMNACGECGQVHQRTTSSGRLKATCSGHLSDGRPCPCWPVKGVTTCAQRHGAGAPQVKRVAIMRQEEARARSMLARLGQPEPIGHPVQALLGLAAEV